MGFLLWILIFLGVLVGVLLLMTIAGLFCAKSHVAGRTLSLKQEPQVVWDTITAFGKQPQWNELIDKVEKMPSKNGNEVWREIYTGNYAMQLETSECDPPKKLVRAIADENGPFSGNWTFTLEPTESGTKITICEYGEIANPFFRLIARMFMNPAKYIELYMNQLAKKFGAEARIEEHKT